MEELRICYQNEGPPQKLQTAGMSAIQGHYTKTKTLLFSMTTLPSKVQLSFVCPLFLKIKRKNDDMAKEGDA